MARPFLSHPAVRGDYAEGALEISDADRELLAAEAEREARRILAETEPHGAGQCIVPGSARHYTPEAALAEALDSFVQDPHSGWKLR